ncbi:MAG: hypothetical protein C0402_01515 [Thermodesulfovibrio sp.]|nr:hypothetical protein [Thermodesulfovibrio sp.]
MIDKFNLTLNQVPDVQFLRDNGEILEDAHRSKLYKFLCLMDRAAVSFEPHKFSERANARIPFSRIDINPKYFECYFEMLAYINSMFGESEVNAEVFHVSRLDIAADIEEFPIDCILSMLRIAKIRSGSFSVYKGTIYAGSDPKIRVYNKIDEIKARLKRGKAITPYEQALLVSGKSYTRFEIQLRNIKRNLADIAANPQMYASQFDRLEIFDFGKNEGAGVLQTLYKYINRKFRKELEKYRDQDISSLIKNTYMDGVTGWFDSSKEPF